MCVGAFEEVESEELGGLHFDEVGAVDGFDDGSRRVGWFTGFAKQFSGDWVDICGFDGIRTEAFDGCMYGHGGNDGVEFVSGFYDAVDEFGGGCGARCVVHHDVGGFGIGGDVREGILHGLPAFIAPTLNYFCAVEGEAVAVFEFKLVEVVGWCGDEDVDDFVALGEEFDGSEEERSPAEVFVEFIFGWAETYALPGCGDDDGDFHGSG